MSSFRTTRATGSAAIALTVAPGVPWQLWEIRLHMDAGGAAGNLTITMDAGAGAAYDTLIYTKAMGGIADVVYAFNPPRTFNHASDELDIAYANGGSATYGIEVIFRPLH